MTFTRNRLLLRGLKHYTNINNLKYILQDKTWKVTNILSMNDKKECIRKDAGREAYNNLFLASFSNTNQENHAMWYIYGNIEGISREEEKKRKILLDLNVNNFLLKHNFESDYLFYYCSNHDKMYNCYINREDKPRDINNNYILTSFFTNIEYLNDEDEVFKESYGFDGYIAGIGPGKITDTRNFGRYKTKAWEYEEEVRLLIRTSTAIEPFEKNFLLIRLRDDFFRDMKIILSPWAEDEEKEEVEKILEDSSLDKDKLGIIICNSSEHGNFI